jgi:DNA ligase D-like protein (predicted 3'-phosphoesterase)
MTRRRKKKNGTSGISTQIELFCFNPPISSEARGGRGETLKSAEEIAVHNRAASLLRFVVKKHRASRLHYDFRLEWNGVLMSWAVPEGPSYCAGVRCEAIEVAGHKVENIAFEGVFPDGMPGAGPTMPWDLGWWEPLPGYLDVDDCFRNGCLKFTLRGEKLKGNWMLLRRPGSCKGGRKQVWDLVKLPDSFARSKEAPTVVDEEPNSVLSGKSLEEVEQEGKAGRTSRKRRKSETTLFKMYE